MKSVYEYVAEELPKYLFQKDKRKVKSKRVEKGIVIKRIDNPNIKK